jgi:hypothetical protein
MMKRSCSVFARRSGCNDREDRVPLVQEPEELARLGHPCIDAIVNVIRARAPHVV